MALEFGLKQDLGDGVGCDLGEIAGPRTSGGETIVRSAVLLIAFALAVILAGCTAQEWSKDGAPDQKQTQAATVTDPVCGMQIDPAKAAGKSDYKGKTYYFCSDHCKKTFDDNPEAVLNKDSKKKQ